MNVIPSSGLDGIRRTQNEPTPGGILDGAKPQVKLTDDDATWNAIKGAGNNNKF